MTNMEIKFLFNGQIISIVVKDIITFYQEKREEVNIINVTPTVEPVTTDISQYVKEKRGLTPLDV